MGFISLLLAAPPISLAKLQRQLLLWKKTFLTNGTLLI